MTLSREGYNRLDREELERLRAQEAVNDARIKALEAEVKAAERRGEQAAFEMAIEECSAVVYQFGKAVPMTAAQQCIDRIRELAKGRAR